MPVAKRIRCSVCGKPFHASRSDTKYHSEKCRNRYRYEDAKFKHPQIPQSGVPGISFNRFNSNWVVKVKLGKNWKYVGALKTLPEAVAFQKQALA